MAETMIMADLPGYEAQTLLDSRMASRISCVDVFVFIPGTAKGEVGIGLGTIR